MQPGIPQYAVSPVYKERLVAFVIDEVHSVKSWQVLIKVDAK